MTPSLQGWLPQLLAWQEFGNNGPGAGAEAADAVAMVIVLLFYGVMFLVAIAMMALIFYVLYSSLARIPAQYREMEPGQVFLLLIPCFNLYWNFEVYRKVPRSFRNYFNSIGRQDVGDCGEQLGLWASILLACGLIPCVGAITASVGGVMVLVLLIKFWGYRNQIPENKLV